MILTSPQHSNHSKEGSVYFFLGRFYFLHSWAWVIKGQIYNPLSWELTNPDGHFSTAARRNVPILNTSLSVYLAEHEVQLMPDYFSGINYLLDSVLSKQHTAILGFTTILQLAWSVDQLCLINYHFPNLVGLETMMWLIIYTTQPMLLD